MGTQTAFNAQDQGVLCSGLGTCGMSVTHTHLECVDGAPAIPHRQVPVRLHPRVHIAEEAEGMGGGSC